MNDLNALRAEADRLGLYLDEADAARVATILQRARASVRALDGLSAEFVEPGYVFTPREAAPKDEPAEP